MSQAGSVVRRTVTDPKTGQRVQQKTWTVIYHVPANGGEVVKIPKSQGGGERTRRPGERVQRTRGGFRTKAEGQAFLVAQVGKVNDGTYSEPSRSTLADYVTVEWFPTQRKVKPSTLASYRTALEGRVLPELGGMKLASITPDDIGAMVDRFATSGKRGHQAGKPLAAKTIRNTLNVLNKVYADAMKRGHVTRNPVTLVEVPAGVRREMKTWSSEEARQFLAAVEHDRLRALWSLLLTTGLRRGESLGLRWSDIDLDAGRLSISQALIDVGYKAQVSTPKTTKSRRSVKMDPFAVAELRAHLTRQKAERLAFGVPYDRAGYVFTREDGDPLQPQLVSQRFERLSRNAGVPSIRLHDCRHTMATLALAAGVHPKVVSERLGHANIYITLDTYSHVTDMMQDEVADTLGTMLLGEAPTPGAEGHSSPN